MHNQDVDQRKLDTTFSEWRKSSFRQRFGGSALKFIQWVDGAMSYGAAIQGKKTACDWTAPAPRELPALEMATLARTVGESLPGFHLDRHDVPTPGGFVVYASPIGSYLTDESEGPERAFITAVSGAPLARSHEPGPGDLGDVVAPDALPAHDPPDDGRPRNAPPGG